MKVIYADSDSATRALFSIKLQSICEAEIIELSSASEVVSSIEEHQDIALIVTDFYMPGGDAGVIFKYLKDNQINIPLILLSEVTLENEPAFDDFFTYNKLNKSINKLTEVDKLSDNIKEITTILLAKKKTKPTISKEYYPINSVIFDHLSDVPEDVFIKISDNKFIRIMKADSILDSLTIREYKEKGITHFFIMADRFSHFVSFCMDNMLSEFVQNAPKEIFDIIKLNKETFHIIQDQLVSIGMDNTTVNLAEQSLISTLELFSKVPNLPKLLIEMETFKSFIYKQSLLRAYISFGISNHFDWITRELQSKLVLISLSQDITLKNEESAKTYSNALYDFDSIKVEHRDEFLSHPTKTCEIYKDGNYFEKDVCEVIAQHHELPDGSGFPKGLTSSQITPLAAINITAGRYTDLITKANFDSSKNREIIQKMVVLFNKDDFAKALEGLKITLNIH